MSSKRRIRRRQCEGKRQYSSITEAIVAATESQRTYNEPQRMWAYKCKFCGRWHIGHKKHQRSD